MLPHHSRNIKIGVAWTLILLAGAVAGWLTHRARERALVAEFFRATSRAALAFDDQAQAGLTASRADLASPAYAAVKSRLQKLRAIDPRLQLMAIVRYDAAAERLAWLADSHPGGAPKEALPGAEYQRAAAPAALTRILHGAPAVIEGPFDEAGGVWVSGYATITEAPGPNARTVPRDILILEADAAPWRRDVLLATLQGALFIWALLGLPFGAWLVLRRQEEQRDAIRNLSEAMEQSRSAILILDLHGRIEYANRGVSQQLGYNRRELLGHGWREFHEPKLPTESLHEVVTTVRGGRLWDGEWTNRRKDGTMYPVRGLVTPVKHRNGEVACYVVVFDDVTEGKRREAELREARDRAQSGDRAKGQFLATMSHEVRTPLNGIVGFTSLLLETPLNAEQREYVQTIKMSTEALIQLTGDILDFARIESGKLNLDPMACDPREAVEDALDLLAAKAAEKKIELLHRVADDVPAAVVTDGGRLRQILVNLIGNAVKFTDSGEVETFLAVDRTEADRRPDPAGSTAAATPQPGELRRETPDTCTLVFTVRDTGIGIPAEHQAKLFRPFTQVDESTTRRYGGTGLGLAISRNLVELLGGTIDVTSEAGRGSAFTFTIRAPVAAALPPVRDLHGLRLGLAMAEGPLRRELAALVRSWNAQVVEADAAAQLASAEWHLAIVDIDEDAARELERCAGAGPALPPDRTVALVPMSLSNELRAALRSHCRLLVNKPVHHSAFFALISGSHTTAAIAAPPAQFGLRVLIVEDNPVNRRLTERVVQNLGCVSTVVENGRQALDELARRPEDFDLVLLDLHMPEVDGLTALREIRAGKLGPRAQTMWIIALTADVREQQRTSGMEAGLNEYLTKPLAIEDLEAALHRFRAERLARKR